MATIKNAKGDQLNLYTARARIKNKRAEKNILTLDSDDVATAQEVLGRKFDDMRDQIKLLRQSVSRAKDPATRELYTPYVTQVEAIYSKALDSVQQLQYRPDGEKTNKTIFTPDLIKSYRLN